jgi:hypothetical protein
VLGFCPPETIVVVEIFAERVEGATDVIRRLVNNDIAVEVEAAGRTAAPVTNAEVDIAVWESKVRDGRRGLEDGRESCPSSSVK